MGGKGREVDGQEDSDGWIDESERGKREKGGRGRGRREGGGEIVRNEGGWGEAKRQLHYEKQPPSKPSPLTKLSLNSSPKASLYASRVKFSFPIIPAYSLSRARSYKVCSAYERGKQAK